MTLCLVKQRDNSASTYHNLFCPTNIIKVIISRALGSSGHVARMREIIYINLFGKPQKKRTAGCPRRKWEDNTKVDLRQIGHRIEVV
jgi:hypothetical protein